jgi:staphyloferrin B biosynthesis citrate synthase
MSSQIPSIFRKRFTEGVPLIGAFVKLPAVQGIEIIGSLGFDFVVIDEEHGPFDRNSIDLALLAARASNIAALVRTGDRQAHKLLAALDGGAAGVLAPHVASKDAARQVVNACRYNADRGYSNATRAGAFGGAPMWSHMTTSDSSATVVAMIEHPDGVAEIEQILSIEGIDGVFVGRADLAVALDDRAPGAPLVDAATQKIILAAQAVHKPVCLYVANASEARSFGDLGVRVFVVSSDQGYLRSGAVRALEDFAALQLRG